MKLHWSPKTKVGVVMVVALLLPIAALLASQLEHLYYAKQTKTAHAIVNQQLLQVIKNVEHQIVVEKDRLGRELAATLEPVADMDEDVLCERLRKSIVDKPYTDLLVFYSPATGAMIFPRPSDPASFEAKERSENADQIAANFAATYDRLVEMLQDGEKPMPGGKQASYSTGMDDFLVVLKRPHHQYNTVHYVLIHDAQGHPAGVLGFTLDRDYLHKTLFPAAYHNASLGENEEWFDNTVVGIRDQETQDLVWSSEPTEFRDTDTHKPFDGATLFGSLYIKLKGESIDEAADDMLQRSLWLAIVMGAVLFGGVFFTWRSVNQQIELARLKSDFVSNVSHELKTPLALIRLFAETLELGRVRGPEKMQEYYSTIRKESERLTGLINNLLDFSRIEAGGKQYRFERTDLACLVGQALCAYRYQLDQKGFQLEENLAGDLPQVFVDQESYSLCVLNLLDNAVKYSGESRQVAVRLQRENGCLRLEVEDRGIGIGRKDQSHIFEKFYRAGDPLVHNTKGSGLGLSLVKHVAQAHHGSISVESSPGQGSKFILKVPIDDASRN
jgi:signal transduction histidine kinase